MDRFSSVSCGFPGGGGPGGRDFPGRFPPFRLDARRRGSVCRLDFSEWMMYITFLRNIILAHLVVIQQDNSSLDFRFQHFCLILKHPFIFIYDYLLLTLQKK